MKQKDWNLVLLGVAIGALGITLMIKIFGV